QVVKGRGRGRNLGFPTANLKPPRDFLLPDGVYAGFARTDGKTHQVAIHVGRAPTFGGKDRRIEVHFLHFGGDLYRRRLEIQFLERIREERKFSNQEELAQRIRQDTRHVAQLLTQIEREGGTNGFTRLSFCANRWQERR
ncbi:MAG: riboflavin kinase, partial [candidate division NC10 bacterium]|nr:riboflavin kinase [candidate division NC10 bacterium]